MKSIKGLMMSNQRKDYDLDCAEAVSIAREYIELSSMGKLRKKYRMGPILMDKIFSHHNVPIRSPQQTARLRTKQHGNKHITVSIESTTKYRNR
jgi:hypothetical protein